MRITEEDILKQKRAEEQGQQKETEKIETKEEKKSEREKLAELKGKNKIIYLWDYYKWVLVVAIAVILLGTAIFSSIRNASKVELLYIMMVDAQTEELDSTELSDALKDYIDPSQDKDYVTVNTACYTEDGALDYSSTMVLTVKAAAQELDVMILPESVYENYEEQDMYLSMEDVMGEEFCENHPEIVNGDGLPVDDNEILGQYGYSFQEPEYIVICASSKNLDNAKAFIQFLGY